MMASIQAIATMWAFGLFGASVAQAADDLPSGDVRIESGRFTMGSPADEERRRADEVQHEVRITRAFAMKKTEVTQGEWKAVMGNNPSYSKDCGDNCPVDNVSWFDAVAYPGFRPARSLVDPLARRCFAACNARWVDALPGSPATGTRPHLTSLVMDATLCT